MIKTIVFLLIMTSSSFAKDWAFHNCQMTLSSFPEHHQTEVIASFQFSSQSGFGSGVARVNDNVQVKIQCSFLNEIKYGMLGIVGKDRVILCESTDVVAFGQKLGIPFILTSDRSSLGVVTYIQFEDGNLGHGTFNGSSCIVR